MLKNKYISLGKRVVVVGLGVSGRSAVRYLLACGAEVAVSDTRCFEELSEMEKELVVTHNLSYEGGGHSYEFLRQAEMVVVSPGVPKSLPVLQDLKKDGIPVLGELALAGASVTVPIIAITGTNGKTTVTSLLGEMLAKAGKRVFVGGNIGTPLYDYLILGDEAEIVVLEVSSFQLEHAGEFRPDVALLLNVSPDHLDWHGSLAEYRNAKAKVFANQKSGDTAILCGDDEGCRLVIEGLKRSNILTFGYNKRCNALIKVDEITVSHNSEQYCFDLRQTAMANHTGMLNAGAAILALLAMDFPPGLIENGLQAFTPPPHRMELVLEYGGITYVNDSKATNTGAVLSGLEQVKRKAVLIAGGREKGEDYSLLRRLVEKKVRHLVLIGEAAARMEKQLMGSVPVTLASSMEEAVKCASGMAEKGDTVLLSPACASFDMFTSYGHRGEVFTNAVRQLAGMS